MNFVFLLSIGSFEKKVVGNVNKQMTLSFLRNDIHCANIFTIYHIWGDS